MAVCDPTLEFEERLLAAGAALVIGCDEVGRGAIAGPVAVGMCAVDGLNPLPLGLRDSKMLSEKRREALAPIAAEWAVHWAVALASPQEVDDLGITACLGLAGKRALTMLHDAGVNILNSVILLDGHQDWLNPTLATPLRVHTRVKADRDCGSVAAASVLAKVHRDHLMIAADVVQPGYEWSGNKGYGSAGHFAAIERLGTTDQHRLSWLKTSARPTQSA